MLFKTVPTIDPRYWVSLILASVLGANTGDFLARNLHLGHVSGLPYLAVAFVAILLAERFGAMRWEGWYWLAIVTVRTAATNLADLGAHDSKFGSYPAALVCLVLLAIALAARRAVIGERGAGDVPYTDVGYWLAMLIAGTLGTALGDGIAHDTGLGVATVLTGLAVALALAVRQRPLLAALVTYWLAVVAIRTFGTNLGDLCAEVLGLATSTALSGLALLAVLALWRRKPAMVPSAA